MRLATIKLATSAAAFAGGVLLCAMAVCADQQKADNAEQNNVKAQSVVAQAAYPAIPVGFRRRASGCCNCCVNPGVPQSAGQQQVAPPAIAAQQPQTTERRSLSVEPSAPVQTFNSAPAFNSTPSFRTRSSGPNAPYLRADSKASRY